MNTAPAALDGARLARISASLVDLLGVLEPMTDRKEDRPNEQRVFVELEQRIWFAAEAARSLAEHYGEWPTDLHDVGFGSFQPELPGMSFAAPAAPMLRLVD